VYNGIAASSWVIPRAICWPDAPVLWGRPKSVAGKWMAPLELLAGCAAAGDEALEPAGGEAVDEVLALAQPAVTTATAETTAMARPVRARRGRAMPVLAVATILRIWRSFSQGPSWASRI
jgi:hypothetical protein